MQILNFVIDVMLKNEVYIYSNSSNHWLDELEYYTHCHLQVVLKFVQPFVGRIRILYSLTFAINTKNRPAIGWTIFSINMHKC